MRGSKCFLFLMVLMVELSLLGTSARAEYRVFLLKITSKKDAQSSESAQKQSDPEKNPPKEDPGSEKYVLSTLDPIQYRYYHSVGKEENISYTQTWKCLGRTNGKDFCPNPKVKEEIKESPSSNDI